VVVKGEVFQVFDEVKDVSMGAGELVFCLLAEGIVPDYPVSKVQADIIRYDLDVGCVVITNRYIE
jgi:hypothetical protein